MKPGQEAVGSDYYFEEYYAANRAVARFHRISIGMLALGGYCLGAGTGELLHGDMHSTYGLAAGAVGLFVIAGNMSHAMKSKEQAANQYYQLAIEAGQTE